MTDIYVLQDIQFENLGGYRPDDEWSRDSTAQHIDLKGWSLSKPGHCDYDVVTVDYTPNENDTLYALCVSYNTGDSFGTDDGRLEVVHLFRNKEVAMQNLKTLGDLYRDKKGGGFTLMLDSGESKKVYTVTLGYFESLNEVFLEPLEHAPGRRISYDDI